uniref:Uncharacterized protein n=1 Tax=Caenorhabditis japonica TaxID=281687 RepID=A0A8R1E799_CAEJA
MDRLCTTETVMGPRKYCPLVRVFGEDAYNSNTYKEFPQYHPVLNQTANAAYMRLYGQCLGIKEPLSICAYNHMACTLKMRPRNRYSEEYTDCRQYLLNCITTATDFLMQSNPSCLNHVQEVIKMIKDDWAFKIALEYANKTKHMKVAVEVGDNFQDSDQEDYYDSDT